MIKLADKQINSFAKKRAECIRKEAIIRKELSIKFPIPNKETREILENDEIVCVESGDIKTCLWIIDEPK